MAVKKTVIKMSITEQVLRSTSLRKMAQTILDFSALEFVVGYKVIELHYHHPTTGHTTSVNEYTKIDPYSMLAPAKVDASGHEVYNETLNQHVRNLIYKLVSELMHPATPEEEFGDQRTVHPWLIALLSQQMKLLLYTTDAAMGTPLREDVGIWCMHAMSALSDVHLPPSFTSSRTTLKLLLSMIQQYSMFPTPQTARTATQLFFLLSDAVCRWSYNALECKTYVTTQFEAVKGKGDMPKYPFCVAVATVAQAQDSLWEMVDTSLFPDSFAVKVAPPNAKPEIPMIDPVTGAILHSKKDVMAMAYSGLTAAAAEHSGVKNFAIQAQAAEAMANAEKIKQEMKGTAVSSPDTADSFTSWPPVGKANPQILGVDYGTEPSNIAAVTVYSSLVEFMGHTFPTYLKDGYDPAVAFGAKSGGAKPYHLIAATTQDCLYQLFVAARWKGTVLDIRVYSSKVVHYTELAKSEWLGSLGFSLGGAENSEYLVVHLKADPSNFDLALSAVFTRLNKLVGKGNLMRFFDADDLAKKGG